MHSVVKTGKRDRRTYARISEVLKLPNLIEIQRSSYEWFLGKGLHETFLDISPIQDFTGNLVLEFVSYKLGEPKYSVEECKEKDATYSVPLRVEVRLINKETGEVKEQEVFMGDLPKMTENGTFVINGAERVIVSQLVRSPGVYFKRDLDNVTGKYLYGATIIPNRGAWLEFETDVNGMIFVRVDRTRKIPVTVLLKALGYEDDKDILKLFNKDLRIEAVLEKDATDSCESALKEIYKKLRPGEPLNVDNARNLFESLFFEPKRYDFASVGRYKINKKLSLKQRIMNRELAEDVMLPGTDEVIVPKGTVVDEDIYKKIESSGVSAVLIRFKENDYLVRSNGVSYTGRFPLDDKLSRKDRVLNHELAEDVYSAKVDGEVIAEKGSMVNEKLLKKIVAAGVKEIAVKVNEGLRFNIDDDITATVTYLVSDVQKGRILKRKLAKEVRSSTGKKVIAKEGVLIDEKIYNKIEASKAKEVTVFFEEELKALLSSDIVTTVNYLLNLMDGIGVGDDIDHLGNRRLRSVGELLQNQFRIGLSRMERVIKERMTIQDVEAITPQALINIRPVIAAVKEFFGSSQLSQFMDQTNPLAELTHKRRLSALGPGGLSRERAGFEVRDVHHSHYGRMCPIETPEGPNIGLIGSLSTYARINRYGFIETPHRKVDKVNKRVTGEISYLAADDEDNYVVAQANAKVDEEGYFQSDRIICRYQHEAVVRLPEHVDYMDVSPKQLVSVATALIPFLENDDANRALMGANMQRQAVPLLKTEAPIVGTGMEDKVAFDAWVMVISKNAGEVINIIANEIVIKRHDLSDERNRIINGRTGEVFWEERGSDKGFTGCDIYKLQKFQRSNQGTCMNQWPIVVSGQKIEEGEVIADGPCTNMGELALGRNVLAAFLPWEGYNFEDAILLSERLVKDDVFTSIHIEEYEAEARDTKLGPEEITRDIPNVGDEVLRDIDERGIIRVGAEVRAGDILVGKVTPKGETELTAEERLLRAIFGEKAREVRDTSLKVPHGESGIVVDVKVFSREDHGELSPGVNQLVRVYIAQKRKISEGDKMAGRHGNKGVIARILPEEDMPFLPDGTPLDIVLNPLGVPSRMNIGQVLEAHLGMAAKLLGLHIASPVFDGANEEDTFAALEEAGISRDGKTVLFDGRTGDPFNERVTVGYIYMLKLAHLVDDKIHARSTGPYSLVTQQPLGGKAQFGGQRFGEMEVWALEAYGAAYTLQEILTIKSDDVVGRVKTYEAIVKGESIPEPGVPESFKVLVKELKSLCLDVKVQNDDSEEVEIKDVDEESGFEDIDEIIESIEEKDPLLSKEVESGAETEMIPEDESAEDEDILGTSEEVSEELPEEVRDDEENIVEAEEPSADDSSQEVVAEDASEEESEKQPEEIFSDQKEEAEGKAGDKPKPKKKAAASKPKAKKGKKKETENGAGEVVQEDTGEDN